jgi:CheY-like chemotaxis protein
MGAELEGRRVLLIEDDEDGAELMSLALERAGATVVHAGTVAEAVAAVTETRFDVLVIDFQLPDGTGLDALPACRAARPDLARAVLALTGHADPDTAARLRAAGFDAVLVKPTAPDVLVQQVGRFA